MSQSSSTVSPVVTSVPPPGPHQPAERPHALAYADVRPGLGPLSRRGVTALIAGLVLVALGLWWNYGSLLGVGVGLVSAVAVDVLLVIRRPELEVRRSVDPPVVERHGECWATLSVIGRRPTLTRIALSDRVGRNEERVDLTSSRVSYRVPTVRRGLIEVGPLSVHRVGLFGLAVASRTQGPVDHVRVLPRLVPVHHLPKGRRRSAVGADESAEHGGTDLVGLHEYVPGDDLRRLHWATSARTGQLMVRDDADPATPHLTVVLDDTAQHYADHALTDTDFEDAVEVAFALCRLAGDREQPVRLVTVSGAIDEVTVEHAASAAGAQRIYEALAEVQPTTIKASEGGPGRAARGMRLARGLDTVAVVSGAAAPLEVFAEVAGRGTTGVVLLVSPDQAAATGFGSVEVLRGQHSFDLARLWDRAVG